MRCENLIGIIKIFALLLVFSACDQKCDKNPSSPHAVPGASDAHKEAPDSALKGEEAKPGEAHHHELADLAKHDAEQAHIPYAERFRKDWELLKDKIKHNWDKLTQEDLNEIHGEFQRLVEKIKEKYQESSEEAERSIREFMDRHK